MVTKKEEQRMFEMLIEEGLMDEQGNFALRPFIASEEFGNLDYDNLARALIVGSSGSGKTRTTIAILRAIAKQIETVLLISETHTEGNPNFGKIFPPVFVWNEYKKEFLKTILSYQQNLFNNEDYAHLPKRCRSLLLVIDDAGSDEKFSKSEEMAKIFCNIRQFAGCVIQILQYIVQADTKVRTNASHIFAFNESRTDCVDKYHKEFFGELPMDVLKQCMKHYASSVARTMVCKKSNNVTLLADKFRFSAPSNEDMTPDFEMGSDLQWAINDVLVLTREEKQQIRLQEELAEDNPELFSAPKPRKAPAPKAEPAPSFPKTIKIVPLDDDGGSSNSKRGKSPAGRLPLPGSSRSNTPSRSLVHRDFDSDPANVTRNLEDGLKKKLAQQKAKMDEYSIPFLPINWSILRLVNPKKVSLIRFKEELDISKLKIEVNLRDRMIKRYELEEKDQIERSRRLKQKTEEVKAKTQALSQRLQEEHERIRNCAPISSKTVSSAFSVEEAKEEKISDAKEQEKRKSPRKERVGGKEEDESEDVDDDDDEEEDHESIDLENTSNEDDDEDEEENEDEDEEDEEDEEEGEEEEEDDESEKEKEKEKQKKDVKKEDDEQEDAEDNSEEEEESESDEEESDEDREEDAKDNELKTENPEADAESKSSEDSSNSQPEVGQSQIPSEPPISELDYKESVARAPIIHESSPAPFLSKSPARSPVPRSPRRSPAPSHKSDKTPLPSNEHRNPVKVPPLKMKQSPIRVQHDPSEITQFESLSLHKNNQTRTESSMRKKVRDSPRRKKSFSSEGPEDKSSVSASWSALLGNQGQGAMTPSAKKSPAPSKTAGLNRAEIMMRCSPLLPVSVLPSVLLAPKKQLPSQLGAHKSNLPSPSSISVLSMAIPKRNAPPASPGPRAKKIETKAFTPSAERLRGGGETSPIVSPKQQAPSDGATNTPSATATKSKPPVTLSSKSSGLPSAAAPAHPHGKPKVHFKEYKAPPKTSEEIERDMEARKLKYEVLLHLAREAKVPLSSELIDAKSPLSTLAAEELRLRFIIEENKIIVKKKGTIKNWSLFALKALKILGFLREKDYEEKCKALQKNLDGTLSDLERELRAQAKEEIREYRDLRRAPLTGFEGALFRTRPRANIFWGVTSTMFRTVVGLGNSSSNTGPEERSSYSAPEFSTHTMTSTATASEEQVDAIRAKLREKRAKEQEQERERPTVVDTGKIKIEELPPSPKKPSATASLASNEPSTLSTGADIPKNTAVAAAEQKGRHRAMRHLAGLV